ncbi:hypothetical protein [Halarsenatibacter silvermanii]|uniref:Uncharacterized protein n=1 Tax=Halarsenatibacter silvermanii TaxID=321763 RepID=A0A1G9LG68_9FIRM|nr:hypothetical protein [Halarsenatibacter silvermanii]SDL60876.1 hypothetical protein SAMN04488692_10650 [Halarsenatibacter silvermanii]
MQPLDEKTLREYKHKYQGGRLADFLPRLEEDILYRLIEVKPPDKNAGKGPARVLNIKYSREQESKVLQIYYCIENYP